ncbi:replication-relaxation family protein [Fodinicola acaciae]|uniref:replication-relaxation family protein n=1 Tax=Fodinicola acaciae TaxID=2681555 RepID=UPI002483AA18|nr:replication-relaxation family protein [Fodinicola acaciae]
MSSENSRRSERHEGELPVSSRDVEVVRLVGRFRQMSARQIGSALFDGLASATPRERALKRLVERGYLVRLGRLVGGDGGGSAQYVYQLGRRGWTMLGKSGAYWAPRAVSLHTLAIADCFVRLRTELPIIGVELIEFRPEPGCHRVVGDVTLTPDAYVEIGDRQRGLKFAFWLEVDRGTEHSRTIREKCQRYWRAYGVWTDAYFPRVVFVVPDERRTRAIEAITSFGPREARDLFEVCRIQEAASVLLNR